MVRCSAASTSNTGRSAPNTARSRRRGAGAQDVRLDPLESRRLLAADVVISEIMHHAPSQDRGEEFVELYNRGDAAANLAGWHFDQGITSTFPRQVRSEIPRRVERRRPVCRRSVQLARERATR